MTVVIDSPNATNRHVATDAMAAPVVGTFESSSMSSRSYVTPASSVSPHLGAKPTNESRDISPDSGDDTDGLYMDGIDDNTARLDHAPSQSSPVLDSSGARIEEDPAVAPATLAETYLPALFAQYGPCAIRHLTQYLAVNNPKFGELPPGRQRRLIVKALELKKGILFEKVGWGRWNHIESKAPDAGVFTPESMPQSFNRNSSLLSAKLKQSAPLGNSTNHMRPPIMGSYPVSSLTSHHDFMFSPSLSVAETSREDEDDGDIDPLDLDMEGEDSETDEEDWKSLGAEALRARNPTASTPGSYRDNGSYIGSYNGGQRSIPYPIRRKSSAGVYQINSPRLQAGSFSGSPSFRPSFPKTSSYLKSSPMSNARASSFVREKDGRAQQQQQSSPIRSSAATDDPATAVERESQADAVEALVMLSGSYDDRRSSSNS